MIGSEGQKNVAQDMAQLDRVKRIMDNVSQMSPELQDIMVKFTDYLEVIYALEARQESEEQLNYLKERFRELVENNPVGMSISTPEGKVIEANPAALKMFGYDSIEEFHEVSMNSHWFDPKDKDRFNLELFKYSTASGFEARLKRKDGSPFWVSITSAARLGAGTFELANFFVDITRRKEEEIKVEAGKLEVG